VTRPHCPHCGRGVVTVGSRPDGSIRIRYLGCRLCRHRAERVEIVPIGETYHRGSNYQRNASGRFAKAG